jgi:activator of HSP90 ATPase
MMANPFAAPVSNLNRRQWLLKSAAVASGFAFTIGHARATSDNGVIRTAEAIHQEISFNSTAKRVYDALTNATQFQKVELLSAAMKGMDLRSHPAEISDEPGGAFSLFGNYIVGRQIQLVPSQRIVQAWRAGSWPEGAYSLVKFELSEQGATTEIAFDHVGFPAGTAEHLAEGWYANYWQPLRKFLV